MSPQETLWRLAKTAVPYHDLDASGCHTCAFRSAAWPLAILRLKPGADSEVVAMAAAALASPLFYRDSSMRARMRHALWAYLYELTAAQGFDLRSDCCNQTLAVRTEGRIYVGFCPECEKGIVRINPITGAEEWLAGKSSQGAKQRRAIVQREGYPR